MSARNGSRQATNMRNKSSVLENKVYIGGLTSNVSTILLNQEFSKYGSIRDFWMAMNPPGFAFVEYYNGKDAQKAINNMNGKDIWGSSIRVELARNEKDNGNKQGKKREYSSSMNRRSISPRNRKSPAIQSSRDSRHHSSSNVRKPSPLWMNSSGREALASLLSLQPQSTTLHGDWTKPRSPLRLPSLSSLNRARSKSPASSHDRRRRISPLLTKDMMRSYMGMAMPLPPPPVNLFLDKGSSRFRDFPPPPLPPPPISSSYSNLVSVLSKNRFHGRHSRSRTRSRSPRRISPPRQKLDRRSRSPKRYSPLPSRVRSPSPKRPRSPITSGTNWLIKNLGRGWSKSPEATKRWSPRRRSRSPIDAKRWSPRKRSRSPMDSKRWISPRRSRSPSPTKRWSPRKRSRSPSPRKRWSPPRRSRSPVKRWSPRRSASPINAKRWSPSPQSRVKSPLQILQMLRNPTAYKQQSPPRGNYKQLSPPRGSYKQLSPPRGSYKQLSPPRGSYKQLSPPRGSYKQLSPLRGRKSSSRDRRSPPRYKSRDAYSPRPRTPPPRRYGSPPSDVRQLLPMRSPTRGPHNVTNADLQSLLLSLASTAQAPQLQHSLNPLGRFLS